MLGSLRWHTFCVYVAMLANSQYTVLISKLSCNPRGHTVNYRVSLDDRCRSVYPASIVAISTQPLTTLLHRCEWYPRPACFSLTVSTVVSSFEDQVTDAHQEVSFSGTILHCAHSWILAVTLLLCPCCNIGSLSPTLTMC
ncbi:hypothetical protein EDD22DRAFT_540295 [Suillus occidentalis]|nr:hypothetical protein EDD22DRAFT_540295 [Suillus occidentalis]